MSGSQDAAHVHEIVIVRRRSGGEEEGHHGGVWKIAFADFMTAMMAFFLVMWLINATDEKTLTQVANYFNPVKLTDRITNPKGVRDLDGVGAAIHEASPPAKEKNTKKDKKAAKEKPKPASDAQDETGKQVSDATLFIDPQAVLNRLAEQASNRPSGKQDNEVHGTIGKSGQVSAHFSGKERSDPFDPTRGNRTEVEQHAAEKETRDRLVEQSPDAAESKTSSSGDTDQATILAAAIVRAMTAAALLSDNGIEVIAVPEGLLIVLTDELEFGMFAIGSAIPVPRLVIAVERIGAILKDWPGELHIRGHTDNRQFRAGGYDNWQLSAARAQIAYHMLLRGGLSDQRVRRIEGHADRSPKVASRPDAAPNRRIEILVRKDIPAVVAPTAAQP